MTYGPTQLPFQQLQLGQETLAAWATAVAATARLLHRRFDTEAEPTVVEGEYQRGSNARVDPGVVTADMAAHTHEVEGTFEQILYPLVAGFGHSAAPAGVGAGADKLWTLQPPHASRPTLIPFTIQKRLTDGAGNNVDRQYPGSLVESITITGSLDGVLMVTTRWISQREQESGFVFTAAVPAPALAEMMPFNNGQLYVDPAWADIGTTPINGRVLSMSWTFNTGLSLRKRQQGSLYATGVRFGRRSIALNWTMDVSNDSQALRALVRSRALRAVRFRYPGSVLGASNKQLVLDQMVTFGAQPAEGTDADTDQTVEIRTSSLVDPTAQQDIRVLVTNAVAALP